METEKKEVKKETKPEQQAKMIPSSDKKSELMLMDPDAFAEKYDVVEWEMAGLRHFKSWAAGKKVTEQEFKTAVKDFRKRPQGG
ncbi:hypothetical protein GMMP15_840016 [Candidatus Magnetomoraceae bacterium gMMP-15]